MHRYVFLLAMVLLPHINGTYLDDLTPTTLVCNSDQLKQKGLLLFTLEEQLFSHCEIIKSLNLSNNNILSIGNHPFKNMKNLKQIDLSSNMISTLPTDIFSDTKNLKSLYISKNSITTLKRNLFANLPYLQSVDFQYNNITYIEEECFVNVPSLTTIDLSHNNLKTLQFNIIDDASSLKAMYLVGNPWNCDPDLCEFMHTVVTRFWQEPRVPSCALTDDDNRLSTFKEVIEAPLAKVYSNVRDNPKANPVVLRCHTCSKSSLSWQFGQYADEIDIANQTVGKYNTVSSFTIHNFSQSNVGLYTCTVDDCSTCDTSSSIWMYMYTETDANTDVPSYYSGVGHTVGFSIGAAAIFILSLICRVYIRQLLCSRDSQTVLLIRRENSEGV